MEIQWSEQGDAIVVQLIGHMDAAAARYFEGYFARLLGKEKQSVVLDLSRLDYICSAGLRSLLMASMKAQEKNVRLLLSNVGNSVKEVFDISGFNAWSLQKGAWVKE